MYTIPHCPSPDAGNFGPVADAGVKTQVPYIVLSLHSTQRSLGCGIRNAECGMCQRVP